MEYIDDNDLKVLEKHGLTLRYEEKQRTSNSIHSESKTATESESLHRLITSYSLDMDSFQTSNSNVNVNTTELQSSTVDSTASDYAFSLATQNATRNTNNRNTSTANANSSSISSSNPFSPYKGVHGGGPTTAAAVEGLEVDDLNRQLDAARQRLNMLEKMLHADAHYHETVGILQGYQEQLAELHEEATKQKIGYHTPVHVARAKERLHTKRMVTSYTKQTAELVGKLRMYEKTIHQQQQLLANPSVGHHTTRVTAATAEIVAQAAAVVIEPLSSASPSNRARKTMQEKERDDEAEQQQQQQQQQTQKSSFRNKSPLLNKPKPWSPPTATKSAIKTQANTTESTNIVNSTVPAVQFVTPTFVNRFASPAETIQNDTKQQDHPIEKNKNQKKNKNKNENKETKKNDDAFFVPIAPKEPAATGEIYSTVQQTNDLNVGQTPPLPPPPPPPKVSKETNHSISPNEEVHSFDDNDVQNYNTFPLRPPEISNNTNSNASPVVSSIEDVLNARTNESKQAKDTTDTKNTKDTKELKDTKNTKNTKNTKETKSHKSWMVSI